MTFTTTATSAADPVAAIDEVINSHDLLVGLTDRPAMSDEAASALLAASSVIKELRSVLHSMSALMAQADAERYELRAQLARLTGNLAESSSTGGRS